MQIATRMTTGVVLMLLVAAALLPFPQGIYAKDELSWVGRLETRPTSGFVGAWTVRRPCIHRHQRHADQGRAWSHSALERVPR